MLPYGRQWIDEDDIAAVRAVLRSDYLTTGPAIEALETALVEATGATCAVACCNGTAALHLVAMALGVDRQWEVFVPAITFAASAASFVHAGATPVFVDVSPQDGLLSLPSLEQALGSSTAPHKLIVAVHLAGKSLPMCEIAALATRFGAVVVEDACHALGGIDPEGNRVGNCVYSQAAVFSFHPVKHIAAGEGGAITTNDARLAAEMKKLRHHSIVRDGFSHPQLAASAAGNPFPWYHEFDAPGFNYRISDIHAALATSQLTKLKRFVERRREIAAHYLDYLEPIAGIECAYTRSEIPRHAFHLAPVRFAFSCDGERARLMRALHERGIGTQVHYIPVPVQPCYAQGKSIADLQALFPHAWSYYRQCLSLPLYYGLSDGDIRYVCDAVIEVFANEKSSHQDGASKSVCSP
ncbi:UDP-4-amino-4,6-dideoxy-N-acetyl-beta-L-altrosamine transaminase [Chrysiogenes arsenatis]|uniref:UDP-4-amino-4, 6-dideoxy-N-acetyl-beta-L-altrosamine transaminase n=1 Tax=Chrysiogenes arsenatis TaxID=309797 RepID=UPI00042A263B|nr:UDP-4-amino-4,6-dideoxy-N-acetyl-beta-L-altrosamine transaminase [Chrysiogenes arsenatis]